MKNILIVGQDALTREPLMGFLSKHEFNIRAVENRQQAASNMASEAIDLAIVDLSYGREDGLQFVRDFGAKGSSDHHHQR
ncbi:MULTISPECIES: response regulator [unclassified Mesorhizobium]|uniref:response regulator n=1 Tax=unclassified Mesorhizobium TaxID=325217 RepID=UPI00333B5553